VSLLLVPPHAEVVHCRGGRALGVRIQAYGANGQSSVLKRPSTDTAPIARREATRLYRDVAIYRRLLEQARPQRGLMIVTLLVWLLATPLTLLTPVPLKIAVDSALGDHPLPGVLGWMLPAGLERSQTAVLVLAAVMMVVVVLLVEVQLMAAQVLSTYTGEQMTLGLRSKLFAQAERLSLAYHDARGTADSAYRMQTDAPAIQYVLVDGAIPLIGGLITIGAMLYVTVRVDWQLGLLALAISPVLLLILKVSRARLRRQSHEIKELESSALGVAQEVLTTLRVVKAFGQESREHERFVSRSGEGARARVHNAVTQGLFGALVGLIMALGSASVLFVGIRHVQAGVITLGSLLLVMGYLAQLYDPLRTVSRKIASLQLRLASAERAFSLLDETPEVVEKRNATPLGRARGHVSFREISFAYGPKRPILRDVSFDVPPATRVGIAGATGAGKTTLLSLLLRFYDPLSGQIILDGVDLRDYRIADLRRQFAIVLQEPVLFSTTVGENISYGRPTATPDQVVASAKAANVHDFITGLPDGYGTVVGERGMSVSGGERQRISIARAFLTDAPILLLDEPTSAVDAETEAGILDAMERLMEGRTVFMIAHRTSTLQNCDVRLELREGRLVGVTETAQRNPVPSGMRDAQPVMSHEPGDHPAAQAWRRARPDTSRPVLVEPVKRERANGTLGKPRIGVFRLHHGQDVGPTIAKRRSRKCAETEHTIYQLVLPQLPIPPVQCRGFAADQDSEGAWLFVEDVGGERYRNGRHEHRILAARWLATVHACGMNPSTRALLPDRGPSHYLTELRWSCTEISSHLACDHFSADDRRILVAALRALTELESRWDRIEAWCDAMPHTLVHGDFVAKNCRVRKAGTLELELVAFDWETAGWGAPAVDLASNAFGIHGVGVDRDTYAAAMRDAWPGLGQRELEQAVRIGDAQRVVAATRWSCEWLVHRAVVQDDLRLYLPYLDQAVRLVRRSDVRRPPNGAGPSKSAFTQRDLEDTGRSLGSRAPAGPHRSAAHVAGAVKYYEVRRLTSAAHVPGAVKCYKVTRPTS
jgi:ATP-binding cassette, subfamily B, bacterial